MPDFFSDIYNAVAGETIYLVVICIFVGFIAYSIFKKLFKISVIIFICLAIYIGYIAVVDGSKSIETNTKNLNYKKKYNEVKEKVKNKIDSLNINNKDNKKD